MSWETIAQVSQEELLQSIPYHWRLNLDEYRSMTDIRTVPYKCGVLTDAQLEITELTAIEIVGRLESRELKAVQVLEAFAARTAVAHQLARIYL